MAMVALRRGEICGILSCLSRGSENGSNGPSTSPLAVPITKWLTPGLGLVVKTERRRNVAKVDHICVHGLH